MYNLPDLSRTPNTLIGENGDGYIVVDGQQRLNAISLGYLPFQPSATARLWIDLADPKDPVQRQYDFSPMHPG